ncbi:hypothetical protein CEXT_376111 [Caerostris extrusa]|uniref:Uncharacterized protein n=1 Tax=Caerostris extrusa TaxID=172846 RepID=A0AAV4V9T4_CAEEX|nr:hypothetical protein CEXT_376111 [Caerostris extrusa]
MFNFLILRSTTKITHKPLQKKKELNLSKLKSYLCRINSTQDSRLQRQIIKNFRLHLFNPTRNPFSKTRPPNLLEKESNTALQQESAASAFLLPMESYA